MTNGSTEDTSELNPVEPAVGRLPCPEQARILGRIFRYVVL